MNGQKIKAESNDNKEEEHNLQESSLKRLVLNIINLKCKSKTSILLTWKTFLFFKQKLLELKPRSNLLIQL